MSEYKITGKVIQVIGPVVDVAFESEKDLPNIYDALEIKRENGESLILETQQAIGENSVRTIAMDLSLIHILIGAAIFSFLINFLIPSLTANTPNPIHIAYA